MNRRMATPYQSETQREVFGKGMVAGACLAAPAAAWFTLFLCRLMGVV